MKLIKLLEVELKKIFKHKSIYIVWTLMLTFCLLNNILYFTDYDEEGNYKYKEIENLDDEINELNKELTKYDVNNQNQITMYVTIKTKLDILNLKKEFSHNSWQYKKINDYIYDTIYQINNYKYNKINEIMVKKLNNDYLEIVDKLKLNDYRYFLSIEITKKNDIINKLLEEYNNVKDEKIKVELNEQIEDEKFKLKNLNYRLNNNIKEDNSYLNNALEKYQENYKTVEFYKKLKTKKTHQDKLIYMNAIKETKMSEYIIENKQNINKENNLNYQLRTIVDDYEIFIVILILIVCSTIICGEFKDGTIKLLLIKPYSRCKILLSKYLTSIIVILISILLLIITQFILGMLMFGLESLNMPVLVFDFNKMDLVCYNVFLYMIIRIIAKMPFLLILITITCFIAVVTCNILVSITMPLMLYMFTPSLVYFIKEYKLEVLKYLVNINWNIEYYLFGMISEVSFINLEFSLLILGIYFISLIVIMFVIFKKKDIKNI